MKLTDITTSLELAKELKEVGFPQDSLFYWQNEIGFTKVNVVKNKFILVSKAEAEVGLSGEYGRNYKAFSAPTVEELGEWLPDNITINRYKNPKLDNIPWWSYEELNGDNYVHIIDEKEADFRAKIVIYLAKNKIIKFER